MQMQVAVYVPACMFFAPTSSATSSKRLLNLVSQNGHTHMSNSSPGVPLFLVVLELVRFLVRVNLAETVPVIVVLVTSSGWRQLVCSGIRQYEACIMRSTRTNVVTSQVDGAINMHNM